MIKTVLFIILVVILLAILNQGKFRGSAEQTVELPKKELLNIQLQDEHVKEYAYLLKDVRDDREAQVATKNVLALSIINKTDFTLTEVFAKITNKKNLEFEEFRLFPVSGSYHGRSNPRIYFAEPHGVNFWSGNFGHLIQNEDEISLVIISARGFR